MLDAAREATWTGEYAQAHALLDRYEATLAQLGAADSDERWGEGNALRAEALCLQGRFRDALPLAKETEKLARRSQWTRVLPASLELQARCQSHAGEFDDAERLNKEALKHYQGLGLVDGIMSCLGGSRLHRPHAGQPHQGRRLLPARPGLPRAHPAAPGGAQVLAGPWAWCRS